MAKTEELFEQIQKGENKASYAVQDSSGKVIDFVPYDKANLLDERARKGKATIYKNDSGWSLIPEVSVSLNKTTGNIDIKAPKSYLESPSFKATYTNSNLLKQISKAYKINPDVKFPDPNDETKSFTAEELVAEYDTALKNYAQAKNSQERVRYNIRVTTGNDKLADMLTENDFTQMSAHGTGDNDNDNTLIAIPTTVNTNILDRAKSLAGYNKDFSQLSRGAFQKELYNLDKSSREDIVSLVTSSAARMAEIARKNDPTPEEVTEYARLSALSTYLSKTEPDKEFWESVGLKIEGGAKGALSGLATVGGNVLIFGEGALNILNYITSPGNWGKDVKDTKFYSESIRQDITAQRQSEQQEMLALNYIDQTAATVGNLANFAGQVAGTWAVGKFVGSAVETGLNWATNQVALVSLKKSLSSMAQLPEVFIAGNAGTIATGSITQTANYLLNLSKISPVALVQGTNILLNALHVSGRTAEIMQTVNNAIKAVNTVGKIAPYVNLTAQLITDVAVTNASILRDVVEHGDTKDVGQLLLTVGLDMALFAGVGATNWLINKFPQTTAGRAANLKMSKWLIGTESIVENTKENLKSMVLRDANYVSKIADVSKRQVGEANALLRKAKTNVLHATGKVNTEDQINKLVTLQNVVNEGKTNIQILGKQLIDPNVSPVFAPAYYNVVASQQALADAIKTANMPVPRPNKKESVFRAYIPQQVDDYIGAYYRKTQLENKQKTIPLKEKEMDELAYDSNVVDSFESTYPGVATSAREMLPALRDAYRGLRDYQKSYKLLDVDKYNELENDPLFTHEYGYIRMQRQREYDETQYQFVELVVHANKRQTTLANQHYEFGSKDHFVNPVQVLIDEMEQVIEVQNARNLLEAGTAIDGVVKNVVVSNKDYKRVETVNKLKLQAQQQIKNEFKGLAENTATHGLIRQSINNTLANSEYLKQATKAKKSGAKVARIKAKDIKATATDRQNFVNKLDNTQLASYADKYAGVNFNNILAVEFDLAISTKENVGFKTAPLRKEIRKSIAASAEYIGWDNALANIDYRPSDLPKIKTSSYKKLAGIKTLKDADPDIKPFLSEKNGIDLEDGLAWSEYMHRFVSEDEVGAFTGTPDDVINFYKEVVAASDQEKELIALTYDNFIQACEFDPDLPNRLNRIVLSTSDSFKSDIDIQKQIAEAKKQTQISQAENLWQEDIDKLSKLLALNKTNQYQLISDLNDIITEYMYSGVLKNESARKVLDALVSNEINPDAAKEYIILSALYNNHKSLDSQFRSQISNMARKEASLYNASVEKSKRIDQEKFTTSFSDLLEDTLYDRRNQALHILQDNNSQIVDQNKIYAEIRELQQKITEAKSNPNMFERTNMEGLTEVVEVDPIVADLVQYSPTRTPQSGFQAFMSNKAFELAHRMFRWNTTTFNAGSFMNQAFRDSLNSYIATGSLKPMSWTEQQIIDNFGPRIAADYQTMYPELYSRLEARAKQTGKTIEETVVRREMAIGESLATQTTATAAARLNAGNAWDITKQGIEKVLEKTEYYAGGLREEYLRRSNYATAYYSALKSGKSVADATQWATRIARDATTDFSHMTYHLQAFTNTIPYLRAAVNGSKSFWRLVSLDPVGVMARLWGGIIIPVMAATMSVLNDEENREYYKTLKEYEKENQLIFSMGGKFYQIPIPQEIGAFVSPMRHLVESLNDGNIHDFWELALNDFFNALPYDFGAWMDIDHNILAEDPTLMDRVGAEFMALFSQFSPTIGKTIFELTFGVDPYTGKPIDKSYWTIDENGDRVLMDSTQSEFAQWLGKATGVSPSVISTVITGIFGNTAQDILDSLTSLASYATSSETEGSSTLLERTLSSAFGKLTVNEYDRTKNQWNQMVNTLYAEKESLLPGYRDYSEKINNAKTAEEREQLIGKRQDYIQPYMDKLVTLYKNLVNKGGKDLDSYRFAMLVNLANWYEETSIGANAYARSLSEKQKRTNKASARQTIESMGISETPGQSLLGYTYRDENGDVKVKYYTPSQIQNAQSIYYTSQDIFKTEIDNALSSAGLTRSKMFEGYSNMNKSQKKQWKHEWNAKVVKALTPYITAYGAETVINDNETVLKLQNIMFIDNPYTAKQYLQKIFQGANE